MPFSCLLIWICSSILFVSSALRSPFQNQPQHQEIKSAVSSQHSIPTPKRPQPPPNRRGHHNPCLHCHCCPWVWSQITQLSCQRCASGHHNTSAIAIQPLLIFMRAEITRVLPPSLPSIIICVLPMEQPPPLRQGHHPLLRKRITSNSQVHETALRPLPSTRWQQLQAS